VKVSVEPAPESAREIVANLLELYLHEFSDMDGREIGEDGRFGYASLGAYWTDPGRYPFLIRVDRKLAGFAMVMEHRILDALRPGHLIAEFFVLRPYRRRRVGTTAAFQLFDNFPGLWWVGEHKANLPALTFWRAVIDQYTCGSYREETWQEPDGEQGLAQVFETPKTCG
jgi:predicted acetyltransferase